MTLRQLRVDRLMSLRQAADLLSISHVFLGEMERGQRPVPARLIAPLAALYEVDESAIRGRAPERLDLSDLSEEERRRTVEFVAGLRAGRAA